MKALEMGIEIVVQNSLLLKKSFGFALCSACLELAGLLRLYKHVTTKYSLSRDLLI